MCVHVKTSTYTALHIRLLVYRYAHVLICMWVSMRLYLMCACMCAHCVLLMCAVLNTHVDVTYCSAADCLTSQICRWSTCSCASSPSLPWRSCRPSTRCAALTGVFYTSAASLFRVAIRRIRDATRLRNEGCGWVGCQL